MRQCLFLVAVMLGAQPAFAQTSSSSSSSSSWRARVSVNLGTQMNTRVLSESITLIKNIENAPLTAEGEKTARFFDGGIVVRLAGNFGAGISVSYLDGSGDVLVVARIPHPFTFDQPRTITGNARVIRSELATHVDAVYVVTSRRIDVAVSAGVSLFKINQDLVSDVTFTEVYPYDTAEFSSATLTRVTASKAGYNAGADMTWKLSRHWGVGGVLRFSRARIPLVLNTTDTITASVGGLQAGAGLRYVF